MRSFFEGFGAAAAGSLATVTDVTNFWAVSAGTFCSASKDVEWWVMAVLVLAYPLARTAEFGTVGSWVN
jgi:hypothetical protein